VPKAGIRSRNSTDKVSVIFPKGFNARRLAMGAPDRFIAWCKQEQASIEQQLELLQAGKVRTGEDIGAGWIDTTDESIERAKARLAELNDLLTDAGTATVVKPTAL
jgi:hypothetical protein